MTIVKRQAPAGIPQGITVRADVSYKPSTLRESDRSVEFVLTTEAPAQVWSWERWDIIDEVLVAKGVVIPKNNQVPLQDSHNRGSVKNTLGSVREIKVEEGQVAGRLYFAKDALSQETFEKVKDGHLDSGSVGYTATGTWIEKGKEFEYEGKTYKGPMQLTTQWDLHEYSVVAVGADADAKVREATTDTVNSTAKATEEDIDGSIESEVTEKGNISQTAVDNNNNIKENVMLTIKKDSQPELVIDTKAVEKAAIQAEKTRASAITALCTKHNLSDMVADFIEKDATIEETQTAVLEKIAERQAKPVAGANVNVEIGATDTEKFRSAATEGLLYRAGISTEAPTNGMANASFKSIARECVRRSGVANVYGMSDTEVFTIALRGGMMGTSDFSHILDSSANMAISKGFASAQQSWKLWANKGSLNNLESAKRVNLDDAPLLLEVDEGEEIKQGVIGDRGEAIQLSTLARKLVITRRALLADDLNLFNRLFAKFGARAGNMIDAVAYGILTANGNMSDGGALFQTSATNRGGNLASVAAVVTGSSVDKGYQAMMAQTVGTDGMKLGIIPRYLLVGPKNRVGAHILTTSMQDTTLTSNANGASNAFSDLVAIATPHLGKDWYMAASPMANDTVEVAFLDGKETPTIYQTANEGDILGQSFVAYFDIGASAIGFQGLFKNAGV